MTTNLITLEEAKAALSIGLDSTVGEALLSTYVAAVSQHIDALVGPVVQRAVTDEVHDGGRAVWLRRYPVVSVTSVTLDGTVLDVGDYDYDYAIGALRYLDGGFPAGRTVTVDYIAGRYASTALVEDRFRLAALICLGAIWRREMGAGTATFGADGARGATYATPRAVLELLSDELIGPAVA